MAEKTENARKQFNIYKGNYFDLRQQKRKLNKEIGSWEKEIERIEKGISRLKLERSKIESMMCGLDFLMNSISVEFDPTGEESFIEFANKKEKTT